MSDPHPDSPPGDDPHPDSPPDIEIAADSVPKNGRGLAGPRPGRSFQAPTARTRAGIAVPDRAS